MALAPDRTWPATSRSVATLAAVAVVAVLPYAVGVLLPFAVNDLHRYPLAEVAGGAHDPKDLWPSGPLAGLLQLSGTVSLLLSPLLLLAVAVAGVVPVVDGLRDRRRRPGAVTWAALLAVEIGAVAALVFLLSPVGLALASWRAD